MNKTVMVLGLLVAFSVQTAAAESGDRAASSREKVVVKSEHSVFKGLFYKVWGHLRSLNPRLRNGKDRKRTVVTMGVRGAETTTSIIEPYWKGDKTRDENFIAQLTEYTRAQELAETGDLQAAIDALNRFLEKYQDSELEPNARFALGLSQGSLGNRQAGIESLQGFIDQYPSHPLVGDARRIIEALR